MDTTRDDVPAETQGVYRVIGIRVGGERFVISKHGSREPAEKVVRLINNSGDFAQLQIEKEE